MRRALFILVFVAACHSTTPAAKPEGGADAAPAQTSPACDHLRALECPEGNPSPGGETCDALVSRDGAVLPVACVTAATTLDAVHACGVRCAADAGP